MGGGDQPSPMNVQQDPQKPPVTLVFWIIWFAILNGLLMTQFLAGGGIPKGSDEGSPPVLFLVLAGGLALAALAVRYVLIPQIKLVPRKLTAMIVGLALSEAIGMIGMFVVGKEFPATQQLFFVAAIGCIVSFAPVYAKPREENGRF